MKRFTRLPDIRTCGFIGVYDDYKAIIDNFAKDMNDEECESFIDGTLTLSDFGGGDVLVVETAEDLKSIEVLHGMTKDGEIVDWLSESALRSANITEAASVFDSAQYTECGEYATLFLASNNAGGDVYYVPRTIADTCPNIAESIKLSEGAPVEGNQAEK